MAPNWVPKPVATIRQRAVPLRTLVPRKTQFSRSRKPGCRCDGSRSLFNGKALAGQDRFADEEIRRLENDAVRGNQAAGRQQDHIAWHDLLRRHLTGVPIAQHAGSGTHARLQGRRSRLRVVLARVSDAHRREHDHEDDDGIHPLAGHGRRHRCEDQHEQQRVSDLIDEHPRARQATVLANLVRSVLAKPLRRLLRRTGPHVSSRVDAAASQRQRSSSSRDGLRASWLQRRGG